MTIKANAGQGKQDNVIQELDRLKGLYADNSDPVKAAKVEQERTRFMELFANADENKLDFIRDHVQQLAWLGITIQELQADVDERGPVVSFQNGKDQTGLQANPACKILKDYQQLYNTQFRALLPILPEKVKRSRLDELREY